MLFQMSGCHQESVYLYVQISKCPDIRNGSVRPDAPIFKICSNVCLSECPDVHQSVSPPVQMFHTSILNLFSSICVSVRPDVYSNSFSAKKTKKPTKNRKVRVIFIHFSCKTEHAPELTEEIENFILKMSILRCIFELKYAIF